MKYLEDIIKKKQLKELLSELKQKKDNFYLLWQLELVKQEQLCD
jgi:hypothetical protein